MRDESEIRERLAELKNKHEYDNYGVVDTHANAQISTLKWVLEDE